MPDAVVTRQLLWLLGHGVAASPSPAMQNAALRACGLDCEYALRDVPPSSLPAALADLRRGIAVGANVTIPHKRAVAAACDSLIGDALAIGAVNTVMLRDGLLVGDNTDALGLEGALRHLQLWPAPGAAVVVLGAGGAAAAALLALSRSAPASLAAVARRPAQISIADVPDRDSPLSAHPKAASDRANAKLRARSTTIITTLPWHPSSITAALADGPSVLVNATPAALHDLPLDVAHLPPECTVVDLRYRPRPVDLAAAAQARGLPACDGLEMLLHQGMLSFERWTGLPAPWDAARTALRAAVDAP